MTGPRADRLPVEPRELGALLAVLVLAAVVRLVGLPGRGTWDADQGHDMLVLLGLVRDGTIPLLGPPTSIGDFHHGALYYYLLSPAAFLSGADPTAVVTEIALAGVAAVAVTWWLARSIAGPVAGYAAALVMAVSSSAIDESTFIWNPNLIALSSAVALAAAWRARTTGHVRWWLVAAFGVLVTMQCHVLGIALLPPVVALWAVAWRATPAGPERRRLVRAGAAGVAIVVLGYLPLAVHELTHDFAESRAALAFIASGGSGVSLTLPARLLFVGLRILAWPLTGLLVSPAPSTGLSLVFGVVAGVLVAAGLAWRAGQSQGRERAAARWLAATLLFGWIVLTFGAAGLATVTPLPVDHYHAFLDPVVFVALGIGVAAVWAGSSRRTAARSTRPSDDGTGLDDATGPDAPGGTADERAVPAWVGAAALVIGLAVLIAWNVAIWPPAVASDGGWPAGRAAGDRIEAALAGRAATFVSLPDFKSADAYRFPVERDRPGVDDRRGSRGPTGPGPVARDVARRRLRRAVRPGLRRAGRGGLPRLARPHGRRGPAGGSLDGRTRSDDLGLRAAALTPFRRRTNANAGPPVAGVRDPRDPDVEGGIRVDGGGCDQ